jgi:hypothetical protein
MEKLRTKYLELVEEVCASFKYYQAVQDVPGINLSSGDNTDD